MHLGSQRQQTQDQRPITLSRSCSLRAAPSWLRFAIDSVKHVSVMQAKLAEKAAMDAQEKIDSQALPIRAYLDQTVVPILLQGLSDLVKARL